MIYHYILYIVVYTLVMQYDIFSEMSHLKSELFPLKYVIGTRPSDRYHWKTSILHQHVLTVSISGMTHKSYRIN